MIQNSGIKSLLLYARVNNMEVMKWCLLRYQETGEESYLEWAKVFGGWSKQFKQDLELF